jgi:hypothetical protein
MDFDARPEQEYRPGSIISGQKSNKQKSSNESKGLNLQQPSTITRSPRPTSNPAKETKKAGKSKKHRSSSNPQPEKEPVINLCEYCSSKIKGPID